MLWQAELSCSWRHGTLLVDNNRSLSFSAGVSVFLGQLASAGQLQVPLLVCCNQLLLHMYTDVIDCTVN